MDVILINPPVSPNISAEFTSTQYPVNLAYIATFLMKNGFKVKLIDFTVENLQNFPGEIEKFKPLIIGISCMTPTILNAHHLAGIVKQISPETVVIVGGAHPTAIPVKTLEEFPNFDIVVIGEGEITMLELVQRIKKKVSISGIDGIAYRTKQGIKLEKPRSLISNLDSLPFPRRDLIDPSLYIKSHCKRGISRRFLKVSELIVSRGCPYHCIFCATHLSYRTTVRFRSADNVLEEIDECIEKYGTNHFSILDDTFTLNKDLVHQLCEGFRKRGVTWDCDTRVNHVSKNMLQEMANSNCVKVSFGVESGSPKILKLIKKGITIKQVKDAFKWARGAGIKYVEGTFMIGSHPDETREDLKMTMSLIKEINPDIIMIAIGTPYPGTELYEIMKAKDYFIERDNWKSYAFFGEKPSWRTKYFSPEELVNLQKKLLREFYLRPSYMIQRISKIKQLDEFKYWFKMGVDFFTKIIIKAK